MRCNVSNDRRAGGDVCLALPALGARMPPKADAAAQEVAAVKQAPRSEVSRARRSSNVAKSPYFGLYEVQLDDRMVYTDAKVTYVIVGSIYDTVGARQPHRRAHARAQPHRRGHAAARHSRSRRSRATARASCYVFADADCPFCKRLESEMKGLDNVTIYTFLFPIDSLHPDSARKSARIWCAADRTKAWDEWFDSGKLPDNKGDCATPIAQTAALGQKYHVNATPTLVFADGSMIPGALPLAQLEEELKQAEAKAKKIAAQDIARVTGGSGNGGDHMAILDFIKKQFIDIIEWTDDSRDTLSFRFPDEDKEIKRGAQLIVRESQIAQFVYLGQFGDTFGPGKYELTTDNIPILTDLKGWKYGFESPFKADVYYVITRLFTGNKWGTANPVMMRDQDFGIVRLRAYGTYDFKIVDPKLFLKEVAGTDDHFRLDEFNDTMRSRIVSVFSEALAQSKIPGARRRRALQRTGRRRCCR